ncbi:hypothetical protein B0J12DRAFT_758522 [Macrophomina phaseolina]|uniref:Uncharacterized protein n=1 Tax=Macrophomina phaseolina TaxID=35725 RepID=A0ABQ8GSI2_9PEZI|nr:hypothetical protein B0J12DRAFT_758522 [Macrophomina phaseolina]
MPRLHITQSSSSQIFVPKSPEEDATARYSVSVPLPSRHIHQVSAKLFVGYLRELPTPDIISNNWEDDDVLENIEHRDQCAAAEAFLFQGYPDTDQMTEQPGFLHPYHHPVPDSELFDYYANGARSSTTYTIFKQFWSRRPTNTSLITGALLFARARVVSASDFKRSEAYFTTSGIIKVDGCLYGLATAHSFLCLSTAGAAHSQTSSDNDDSSGYDSDEEFNRNSGRQARNPLPSAVPEGKWERVCHPPVLAYAGRGAQDANFALPDEAPRSSDFALLPYHRTGNERRSWPDQKPTTGIASAHQLHPGPVEVLHDPERKFGTLNPLKAHLLPGKSSIILGANVVHSRKVQLPSIASTSSPVEADGISGAWATQDSLLCGIVFASSARSPYLRVPPAEGLFADIASYLGSKDVGLAQKDDFPETHSVHEQESLAALSSASSAVSYGTSSDGSSMKHVPSQKRRRGQEQ